MKDVFWTLLGAWLFLTLFNQDDNFARYLGQFAAEAAKGFADGGVP